MSPTSPFNDDTKPDTERAELIFHHAGGRDSTITNAQYGRLAYHALLHGRNNERGEILNIDVELPDAQHEPVTVDCRTVTFLWLREAPAVKAPE